MSTSIELSDDIWAAWTRKWHDVGRDADVTVRLVTPAGTREAAVALQASIEEARAAFEDVPPREELDGYAPMFGSWDWLRLPTGVLIATSQCEDYELALRTVVDGLQRRGLTGQLVLEDDSTLDRYWLGQSKVRCHIRVLGTRTTAGPGSYVWVPSRGAHAALIHACCAWVDAAGDGDVVLSSGDVPPVKLDTLDDLPQQFFDALDRGQNVSLRRVAGGGARRFTAHGSTGSLALAILGARASGDAWRAEIATVIELLTRHADEITYAFVARGWPRWQRRPDDQPRGARRTRDAFEDLYVPDAFGVQLLGPALSERLHALTLWHVARAGKDRVLLTSTDPDAWFDEADVPRPETRRQAPEPPAIVHAAREELAPILRTFRC